MTFHDVVRLADLKAVLDKHQETQSNGKAALSCLVIFAKWHDPATQLLKVVEALAEVKRREVVFSLETSRISMSPLQLSSFPAQS